MHPVCICFWLLVQSARWVAVDVGLFLFRVGFERGMVRVALLRLLFDMRVVSSGL